LCPKPTMVVNGGAQQALAGAARDVGDPGAKAR